MANELKRDDSGLGMNFGSYEEAKSWLGRSTAPTAGDVPVNVPMIRLYCSAMQDGNPTYWDDDFAAQYWGGPIAPPGMLQTWTIPLQWRPGGTRTVAVMAAMVPLPGDKPINVSTEIEYFEPIRAGDIVTMTDRLIDISEEKATRIGVGHFITTIADYRNQRGELLARGTNVFFRYRSKGAS